MISVPQSLIIDDDDDVSPKITGAIKKKQKQTSKKTKESKVKKRSSARKKSDYVDDLPIVCQVCRVEGGDYQDPWEECVNRNTEETVYVDFDNKMFYYPLKGAVYNIYGEEVENYSEKYGSVLDKIAKIAASFSKADTEPIKAKDGKKPMYAYKKNDGNMTRIRDMGSELLRSPLKFTYKNQTVYNKKTKEVSFIEWQGVAKTEDLYKGKYRLGDKESSQPTRLLRIMLMNGYSEAYPKGFPRDLWDSTTKKGKHLRSYKVLTTIVDGKVWYLKELFPSDTRKDKMPQKPKKSQDHVYSLEIISSKNKKVTTSDKANEDETEDDEDNEDDADHDDLSPHTDDNPQIGKKRFFNSDEEISDEDDQDQQK